MARLQAFRRKTADLLVIYWELARLIVPITLAAEALSRAGVIKAIAPAFAPVMSFYGLPPELGLAWLTGMLVGIWGALPLIFTLVPVSELTTADITVFSALLLFTHALPIEQGILRRAGAAMIASTAIRVLGGLVYAAILHRISLTTGWLDGPIQAVWTPMAASQDWPGFLWSLAQMMLWMLVILLALGWGVAALEATGTMAAMNRAIDPVLRLAGIRGEARQFAVIGTLLGIAYGGGLMIREAQSGRITPRQILAACIFMGFAHGMIEDTAVVMAIGADGWAMIPGRLIFAIVATAAIMRLIRAVPDRWFHGLLFVGPAPATAGAGRQPG
ncbi:nucleoside recognition domain-containing protein [Paracoccus pacificus]|uniref:Nucleoside recognition domain-containing protein n=1 Tax=Paracoccus pacificus TaxID=1463598 RepID=A0ABW4R4L7_9RHOB